MNEGTQQNPDLTAFLEWLMGMDNEVLYDLWKTAEASLDSFADALTETDLPDPPWYVGVESLFYMLEDKFTN